MRAAGIPSAFLFLLLIASPMRSVSPARAGDWPQILGPARSGIAVDEKLAEKWPNGGPRTIWQKPVGDGYSGTAVSGGRVILFHRLDDEEVVECLHQETGQVFWKRGFETRYQPSYTSDGGPRAVPLIHQDRIFLYGARGGLYCVALADGKVLWKRDLYDDFSSRKTTRGEPPEGYFGFGSTPIVEGDRLVLNVGGDTKEAGIVAFHINTGETLWKATRERASYSSPVAATIGGQRHLIFATRLNVVSVDPENGRLLLQFPFGQLGPAVTAANPLVLNDNHIFITASYGFGATYAMAGPSGVVRLWESDDILSSQYTTPILHNGLLFGIHGRQDIGEAELRCVDPKLKQVLWSRERFGYATLILAGGRLLAMKTDGELVMVQPDAKSYQETARARLLTETSRALPALSNGRFFVRDTSTLKCIDLR